MVYFCIGIAVCVVKCLWFNFNIAGLKQSSLEVTRAKSEETKTVVNN